MTAIIEAHGVVKVYGDIRALDGVDLLIDSPMTYALLGPNGSGKTTLINIIVGITRPTRGSIIIMGSSPRDRGIRERIGFVSQKPGLYDLLSGWDNALLYAKLYGVPGDLARKRIRQLAERLGILGELDKKVGAYSGGMKAKLNLLIGLIHDPDILVLDEPTTGMDPGSRRTVWEIMREHRERGRTVLLSTHYMEEADQLADRVGIMFNGRIIAEGSPEDLKKKYGPKSVIEVEVENYEDRAVKSLMKHADRIAVGDGVIRIHTPNPDEDIPFVAETLYKNGVRIRRLQVVKPTLEDVFLKLTGRRLGG